MEHRRLSQIVLILCRTLAEHRSQKPGSLAKFVTGDPKSFYDVEQGKDFQVRTFDRWVQKYSDAWPEDLPWPVDIERPPVTASRQEAA